MLPEESEKVGLQLNIQKIKIMASGPIDSSPPGSTVPGILQARVLEWVAIAFSRFLCRDFHFRKKFSLGISFFQETFREGNLF